MMLRGYQITSVDQIGGGEVRAAFRMGTRYLFAGTRLTAEEVISINRPNRAALIDKGMLAVWPKGGDEPIFKGKRYAIHYGGGAYDVIEGRKLNDKPLTREEAQEMAKDNRH